MNLNITKDDAWNFIQLLRQTQSAEGYKRFQELSDAFKEGRINSEAYATGTMELIKGNETLVHQYSQKFRPSSSQPTTDSSTCTTSDGEDPEAATTSTATVEDPAASRKTRKNKSKKVVEKHGLQQKEDKTAVSTNFNRVWEITDDEEKKVAVHMFVQRVKDRAENYQVFKAFSKFVRDFQNHRDVDRVNNQVCELFKNQPELHIEFSSFLVDAVEEREKKREREEDLEVAVQKKQKRATMAETESEKELNHEFAGNEKPRGSSL